MRHLSAEIVITNTAKATQAKLDGPSSAEMSPAVRAQLCAVLSSGRYAYPAGLRERFRQHTGTELRVDDEDVFLMALVRSLAVVLESDGRGGIYVTSNRQADGQTQNGAEVSTSPGSALRSQQNRPRRTNRFDDVRDLRRRVFDMVRGDVAGLTQHAGRASRRMQCVARLIDEKLPEDRSVAGPVWNYTKHVEDTKVLMQVGPADPDEIGRNSGEAAESLFYILYTDMNESIEEAGIPECAVKPELTDLICAFHHWPERQNGDSFREKLKSLEKLKSVACAKSYEFRRSL